MFFQAKNNLKNKSYYNVKQTLSLIKTTLKFQDENAMPSKFSDHDAKLLH